MFVGYMFSLIKSGNLLNHILLFCFRISPKEWTNPYPCIDEAELEELENQFSLNNSFWFVTGSIMQQGSELAPMSVQFT